jgi:peptide/nickel transport system ATP-binding protein
MAETKPLIDVRGLARDFDVSRPWLNRVLEGQPRQLLKAVDGVSFTINKGETLSLVGESGCGKSTVARLICGLYSPTAGEIRFDGQDMASASAEQLKAIRRRLQMIFQDPYASLNPRWRVKDIIAEPITAHGITQDQAEIDKRVADSGKAFAAGWRKVPA